jgi:hypothetical protein
VAQPRVLGVVAAAAATTPAPAAASLALLRARPSRPRRHRTRTGVAALHISTLRRSHARRQGVGVMSVPSTSLGSRVASPVSVVLASTAAALSSSLRDLATTAPPTRPTQAVPSTLNPRRPHIPARVPEVAASGAAMTRCTRITMPLRLRLILVHTTNSGALATNPMPTGEVPGPSLRATAMRRDLPHRLLPLSML